MRSTLSKLAGVAAAAAGIALVAACSSGTSSSNAGAGSTVASSPAASTTASSSAPAVPGAVATASSAVGTYLVDKTGKAIYILTSDVPNGASACTAACLKAWPPIAAPSPLPSGLTGITAKFGTFTAADGSSELTVNGYPAYNFIKDTGPGTTNGQGVASFGGTWWLLSPSGDFITTKAPAAPASSAAPTSSAAGAGAYNY